MLAERLDLWNDGGSVILQTYVLEHSQEYRANERFPAVVICPGGAYLYTSDREAEPIAMKFAALGYHTFVLRYNTYYSKRNIDPNQPPQPNMNARFPQPLFDLAKALITVREHAEQWNVDTDRIAVSGFSAGGHLAASLGAHWKSERLSERFGADKQHMWKPNALILGYPLLDYLAMKEAVLEQGRSDESKITLWNAANLSVFGKEVPDDEELWRLSPARHITADMPPTFMWHTATDDLVPVTNSLSMAMELTRHRIPYELHVFEEGVHGLAAADVTSAKDEQQINPAAQAWIELAATWLQRHFAS